MELRITESIEASQSVVCLDKKTARAFKLFKSFRHPSNTDKDYTEQTFNDWKRKIFQSEKRAYELISKSSVRNYFSNCYDDIVIDRVLNEDGADVSEHYLLDCVLILDILPGEAIKQNMKEIRDFCSNNNINLIEIFNELRKIGVNFFIDSSVFIIDSGIKIVDIATNDFADFQPADDKGSS